MKIKLARAHLTTYAEMFRKMPIKIKMPQK